MAREREGEYPETITYRPKPRLWAKMEDRARGRGKGVPAVVYARDVMFNKPGVHALPTNVLRDNRRMESPVRIPVPKGTRKLLTAFKTSAPGTFFVDTEDAEIVESAFVLGEPGITIRRRLSELLSP